jgi:hypothetical protein
MVKISTYSVLRYIAIGLGLLPAAFFLVFLIGEGFAELLDGKLGVLPILAMMLFTVSGYILAFKRPRNGGIIMMVGGVIMGTYLLITGGILEWDIAALYSLPFVIPGFLFMQLRNYRIKTEQ